MSGAIKEKSLEAVEFVGLTLAPFFLVDPKDEAASAMLEAIASIDPSQAGGDWPFVDRELAEECLASMKRAVAEGDREELIWEYRRLFVGPAARPAPPWGSVYMDRDCVVFGVTEIELVRWMREKGLERRTRDKVPEDHIGLMLAQMAFIARYRPELLCEYLEDHLLTWSHHFLALFADASSHPFYHSLAVLTDASLEGIKKQEGLHVVYPRYYR